MTTMSTTDLEDLSNLRVDLHSHTNCSDGALTPQELIQRAVNFQLDVLAITDHDTVSGLAAARKAINDNKLPLRLIDGIEISTQWQGFEIHIVGLNIDPNNAVLAQLINTQQQCREQRAIDIGKKLTKCGFAGVYEEAKLMAGEGSITRAHFARVLLQRGVVVKMQAAFDKYIGKGKRAYVKPNWVFIKDAISVIHQAGGVAVMAHPVRYDLSTKWLRRLIVEFKNQGGDGLEIVLPQMNNDQRRLMLSFCNEYGFHASMGSDFHQPSRWSDLGRNLIMPEQAQPIWQVW